MGALKLAARSRLGAGLEFTEGLGGLGEGVGEGSVPVHVGAVGALPAVTIVPAPDAGVISPRPEAVGMPVVQGPIYLPSQLERRSSAVVAEARP